MENQENMPIGFAFQLSMNEKAMDNFAKMNDAEKRQVLEAARNTPSKAQMRSIIEDISNLR